MNLKLNHIVSFCKGVFHGNSAEFTVNHISIDSRSLQNGNNTLFFAIKGQNHDAHLYLDELIAKGVRYFVVEYIPEHLSEKANFIIVENSLKALQQTSIGYRKQFDFPFVGITGSNGKTIVKEWLNFLLSAKHLIVRNPKSYNSQVGVPLSILGIEGNYDLGIFEAGISLPNEMSNLEQMIQPKYGILTTIGSAHDEGFQNREAKINEKITLFKNCSDIFLEKNDKIEALLPDNSNKHTWSFSDENAQLFVSKKSENGKTKLTFKNEVNNFTVIVPFSDENSIENVITCVNFMLFLGEEIAFIQNRVAELYPIELRLQAKKGINNCLVIDDSYSFDYPSLKIALDFFEQQKLHDKKTIILSDIFTDGIAIETLYNQVKQLLSKNKIERIITIGETIGTQLNDLPNVISFATTQEFLQQFNTQSFQNETILVKGARGFNFNEIVVVLEEKNHETILEINLDAISHNLNFYKSKLKPETKIMVMVKAFGYGNGGYEIAKLLEHHKVDYLGVAFADEGIELRKAGIATPIMVLNPENSSFRAMIAYNLEPEIYSITGLQAFLKIAQEQNISNYPIHIKLDTGMHRLGFEAHLISELISLLKNNNFVKVKSVFSHLAASDDLQFDTFTQLQFQRFDAMYSEIEKVVASKPIRHILNTSGIFNYANKQMEMVRLGIGLYGIGNSEQELQSLENVSTLKTIISQIRAVLPEESIGYSRKFRVSEKIKVATIPVGYADGIRRSWGNEKGFVTINNQKATILGSICMDMMMVDVTNINCSEGDEVIVFGTNPKITEIATTSGTISYEILTGISQRVKRIFYKN
ncbi:bifunctional UDP-N-acetylmuramoyl-tripeptide:D-alanyl-D-alanine ligase/alanine racemase [Flavobacterium sp.]|uniref:bifunctional UDP-N-acetylmuramoyl-tripeptide:D-alanyl-D-alanine ligase/alanine racemase n=1 Tax=Flavobacterium sp. TaxID=239 RepID=UPI0037C05EA8